MSMKQQQEAIERIKSVSKNIKSNRQFSHKYEEWFNHLCTCWVWLKIGTKEWDKCTNCWRIIPEFIK